MKLATLSRQGVKESSARARLYYKERLVATTRGHAVYVNCCTDARKPKYFDSCRFNIQVIILALNS